MTSNNLNASRPQSNLGKTYGKINNASIDTKLWLSRLPQNLAHIWDAAPEGTLLGTLTFTKGTPAPKRGTRLKPGQKQIQQKLSLEVSEKLVQSKVFNDKPELAQVVKDLPLDYTVANLTTKIPVYHPFSRKEDGSVELHGTVNRSCNLQIERTKQFRHMCNTRMAEAGAKQYVKSIDEQTEISLLCNKDRSANFSDSSFGTIIAKEGKKMNEAPPQFNNKRKFSETQGVRSILFELFQQTTHWAMKELRGIISGGRTEKEIRTELQQIADYHKTGEFKGFWQLKSEFAGTTKDGKNDNGNSAS